MRELWPLLATILLVVSVVGGSRMANEALAGPNAALVAPAEMVVDQFMQALSRHRWAVARQYLADEVRAQATDDRLSERVRAIEERYGAMDNVQAKAGERDGERATARVEVKTRSGVTLEREFELTVEQGAWLIADLEPLAALGE